MERRELNANGMGEQQFIKLLQGEALQLQKGNFNLTRAAVSDEVNDALDALIAAAKQHQSDRERAQRADLKREVAQLKRERDRARGDLKTVSAMLAETLAARE